MITLVLKSSSIFTFPAVYIHIFYDILICCLQLSSIHVGPLHTSPATVTSGLVDLTLHLLVVFALCFLIFRSALLLFCAIPVWPGKELVVRCNSKSGRRQIEWLWERRTTWLYTAWGECQRDCCLTSSHGAICALGLSSAKCRPQRLLRKPSQFKVLWR